MLTGSTERHKHADIIHAWAEGQVIQVKSGDTWSDIQNPLWDVNRSYRIKPRVTTLRYRRYISKDTADGIPGVFCWQHDMRNKYNPQSSSKFVRWIDFTWQEADMEE